ncbi:MAG: protoheme IX farnesyltransferase [bacterium]|nr:protoheme IX farnesyltransferase [bacterium]
MPQPRRPEPPAPIRRLRGKHLSELAASWPAPLARLKDLVDLGKPRLSFLVIFTCAIGVWFAPSVPSWSSTLVILVSTSVLVAAANTLNCWIEREIDRLMHRTRDRPLPAGRLEPGVALVSGSVLSIAALTGLALSSNGLTTLLGAVALGSYVLVYTPLKRFTPWALLVGAVPGALPPLMGWTASTGSVSGPGLYLFGILFLWQLPHFAAIAIYLKDDFARGGFPVLAVAHGEPAARRFVLLSATALVLFTLAAWPLGYAGPVYFGVAGLLGLVFLGIALRPGAAADLPRWARGVFSYTLLYLPLLIATLVLDRVG